MMKLAGEKGCIPDDLFAKKLSDCNDATMTKVFFADVSKVMHHPARTMNNFGDCYDRSAHTIQSVALRAHGIPKEAVRNMLTCLQIMQFCVRTGFGESKELFRGTLTNPTMGLGMGNGAGPPSFTVLWVLIVNVYKRKGDGAELTLAHMARVFLLAAIMYIIDTILLHRTKSKSTSDEE